MEKDIEIDDSSNVEDDITPEDDAPADAVVPKEKYEELAAKNRQLFERAKRAEGFDKVEGKWVKTQKPEIKPEPKPEVPPQSNEPDYATKLAVKTYLNQKGYDHPDDHKWIQDEANRLKMLPDEVLEMEHVKSHLTNVKTQREALAGMPKGRGNASGQTQNDVDYWLAKGETPDDLELAEKVIDARMKKETNSHKFSDELYTG